MWKYILPAILLFFLNISIMSPPAHGLVTEETMFDMIPCGADDNNTYQDPTWMHHMWAEYNSVCDDDYFDWYAFAGEGDVDWDGVLMVVSDRPGLAVRLYFDNGLGLAPIKELGVTESPTPGLYFAQFAIRDLCLDEGFPSPLNGFFYIRIFYYSAFPGEHPYYMQYYMKADPSIPGGANLSLMADPLGIDMVNNGTLNSNDPADWYYWEHPDGEPVDGFIEGVNLGHTGLSADAPLNVALYDSNDNELANARLNEKGLYCTIDLEPLNLTPGRYYIKVELAGSFPFQAMYQIRNRATLGSVDGYNVDANDIGNYVAILYPDITITGAVCRPRDYEDYYGYISDTYFIGDILLDPVDGSGLYGIEVSDGVNTRHPSISFFRGACFQGDPLPPGDLDIKVYDFSPAASINQYDITVYPNGGGPFNAPGHPTWQDAREILDDDKYIFELNSSEQDRYCFHAGTGAGQFLSGFLEIYGSSADYELQVGVIQGDSLAWGDVYTPLANGKITLDFAYDILVDPGEYILRIKLNDDVTSRRRFYISSSLTVEECWQEGIDDLYNLGGYAWINGKKWEMKGLLCPPDDASDYMRFTVADEVGAGVPLDYRMVVRAGYPGMEFRLYDSFQNLLWETTIEELGGSQTVYLQNLVQVGETYVVEASITTTEERPMVWRADFLKTLDIFLKPSYLMLQHEFYEMDPEITIRKKHHGKD